MDRRRLTLLAAVVAVVVGAAGLLLVLRDDGDEDGDEATATDATATDAVAYAPEIDPAEFTGLVDHPLLPLAVGTRWVYEGETEDGVERTEVEVTADTKQVMGIDVVVVHDTEYLDGEVVEDTFDWFAQDAEGNVWYFGEDTRELEAGEVVSTEGSWEAGIDGAQPGIIMPADPEVGDRYRQEYYAGEAEDWGEILALDEAVDIGLGSYDGVLRTKDTNDLEPDVVEHKYYAPGVGVILEEKVEGGEERHELVEFTPP